MKKLFVVMAILLSMTMLFIGCGKTDNSSPATTFSTPQPNDYDTTGTIQGKIMDAITGEAIGNDADGVLNIWLIQGTTNRGADKLDRDKNSPLCGEYAFSGIPVSFDWNGNAYFKIVVDKGGYQRFEAEVELGANYTDVDGLIVFDTVINMIGNIYLFPLGTTAGNVSVYVRDPQGTPVSNAMVLLRQQINSNTVTAYTSDRLSATNGLNSSLTGTTDAAGMASFASADLTLGGSYSVVVEPINFLGEQLAQITQAAFTVGTASTTRVINMAVTNAALFATSASNQVPGTITASGVLTVTFNQPIILSTTTFTGVLISSVTGTVGSATGALDTAGTTLTITPAFTTPVTGAGATITYTYAGTITYANSQVATVYTLFGGATPVQNITTGAAVSGAVQMIAK